MRTIIILSLSCLAFGPGFAGEALKPALPPAKAAIRAVVPPTLQAVDSVPASVEAAAKRKADSLRFVETALRRQIEDSAHARAAALAKRIEDSLRTLEARAAKATAPAVTAKKAADPAPTPAAAAPPVPATAGCSVIKVTFATQVEAREPVGEGAEFPASVGRINCWTRIACGPGPMKIRYAWYKDGVKQQEIPISMKSSGRGWTRVTVSPGKWKVDVLQETGESIGGGEVTIKPTEVSALSQ